jgi:hypothetical protein
VGSIFPAEPPAVPRHDSAQHHTQDPKSGRRPQIATGTDASRPLSTCKRASARTSCRARFGRFQARRSSVGSYPLAPGEAEVLVSTCVRRGPRPGRHSHRLGVGLPLAAGMRLSRVPWLWRNSRLRAPTRMGPASVFPRVSRQSTFGRAGRVQTRRGTHVVPVIGIIETSPMRSRTGSRCRTTATSC